jgi:hypothetical protein
MFRHESIAMKALLDMLALLKDDDIIQVVRS